MTVTRIAYQGVPGAFSEAAIAALFPDRAVEAVSQQQFADVRTAVLSGEVDLGVLPLLNTIHGPVHASLEVLEAGGLVGLEEIMIPIHLCLLAVDGATLEDVRTVLSHPVALGQCRRFMATLRSAEPVPFFDTAGAAREVSVRGDVACAAVASRTAAARYGLTILAENIEDRPDNQTRFRLVARAVDTHHRAAAMNGASNGAG